MKKIYSIVLMATALLIGTNAWAQNTISLEYYGGAKADQTFATLQEAIDYVNPGDSATITLSANQTLSQGILIPHVTSVASDADKIVNRAGQRICINLSGKTIQMTSGVNHAPFSLLKGTLRFTGTGIIKREADRNGNNVFQRCAIAVTGADADKNNSAKDRSKKVWSTLFVDKDVTIIGHGNDCFGIGINEIDSASDGVYPRFADFKPSFLGYTCKQTHGTGNMWDPTTSGSQYSAFGVRVFINGTVDGTVRGVNVCGNINQTPGIVEGATARKYAAYPFYDHNFPYVKIGKDADVYCDPSGITDNGNGGIYLGGWAVIDIEGAVHGQTGVMVKAGDVLVQNGSVYSDCPSASFTGNYHGTVEGSGIFVASSASYAGESSVTVAGDSYIAGKGGCAIVDVCATSTKEQTNTAVTHIDINGGTIVAGEVGAISLGTNTSNVTDITGGVVEGKVDIGDASDESQRFHTDVTTLLPNNDDYHTTTVTVPDPEDPTKTKTVVVVSEGGAPEAPVGGNMVSNQPTDASIKWTVNTKDTIKTYLKLAELEINTTGLAQELVIKENATLEVGRVVLGSDARIVVEAGAKFIVTGEQGIVAPVAENIVLKASASNHATFLFNPAVTSNRHPNATVEYVSKSFVDDASNYQWERVGIPTWKQLTAIEVTCKTAIAVFENNGWTQLGFVYPTGTPEFANIDKLDKPFVTYNMISYRTQAEDKATYTFKGELVGNTDAALNADREWNGYPNSYMADVDAAALLAGLSSATSIDKTIYLPHYQGNGYYTWDPIDNEWIAGEKVAPMQSFILRNGNSAEAEATTLSYKNTVWNPGTGAAGAPRRFAKTNDNTAKLRIIVTNENGIWDNVKMTESATNNHNAVKYMNDDVNIYAMADEKEAIVAAENIENTYVGFSTVKGGKFTISFANVEGHEFVLVDHETGAQVAIAEGNTYEFTAAANSTNDYRFEIINTNGIMTGIENAEAVKSVKGIYTITGQYVGEMNVWNSLPAGVYVVNGEKRVK